VAEGRLARPGSVRVYDFRRPDRFSKEQLRALHMVHEHAARGFATALSACYRGISHVHVRDLHQETFGEFVGSLSNPTVLAVISARPLEGRAVMELDPALAFPVLDRMFGGAGEALPVQRALTDIEQTVIRRVLEMLARSLGEAWSQVEAVTPALESVETSATFLQVAAPSEVVLTVEFSVQMGPHQGLIRLSLPYIMLEPLLPRLSPNQWFRQDRSQRQPADLERHLGRVEVTLAARLGRAWLRLGELLELEVGDVIQLQRRRDEPAEFLVEDRAKFLVQVGQVHGRLALRILGPAEAGEEVLPDGRT
jgi:flagellar motor switch protein FliM